MEEQVRPGEGGTFVAGHGGAHSAGRAPRPDERPGRGDRQAHEAARAARAEARAATREGARAPAGGKDPDPEDLRDLRRLPTRDLVMEIAKKAKLLARAEIELAKREVKEDLRSEIKMASGLGVAGLCGILALAMLLVTIAFALQEAGVVPGWLAAILVAAVVLAIGTAAGLWGWAKRVRTPLDTTRRSIQENVRWAKDRIA
jgi:uncharacterized membrane protein YqjE